MNKNLRDLLEFLSHNYRIHHSLFYGYDVEKMVTVSNNCFRLSSLFTFRKYNELEERVSPGTLDPPFVYESVTDLVEAIHVIHGYELVYVTDNEFADLLVSRAADQNVLFIITEKDYEGIDFNNYSKHLFGDLRLYNLDLVKCYKNGLLG